MVKWIFGKVDHPRLCWGQPCMIYQQGFITASFLCYQIIYVVWLLLTYSQCLSCLLTKMYFDWNCSHPSNYFHTPLVVAHL